MKQLIVINWKFDPEEDGQDFIQLYPDQEHPEKILTSNRDDFFEWLDKKKLRVLAIQEDEPENTRAVLPINFDFERLDYMEVDEQWKNFDKLRKKIEKTAIDHFGTDHIDYIFFQHINHGFSEIWKMLQEKNANPEVNINGKLIKFAGGYDFLYSQWGLLDGDFPTFNYDAFLQEETQIVKSHFDAVWNHYQLGTLVKLKHLRAIMEAFALEDEMTPKSEVDTLILNFLLALVPEPAHQIFREYVENKRGALKDHNFYKVAVATTSPIIVKSVNGQTEIDPEAMIYNFSSSKDINPKLENMQELGDHYKDIKEKLVQAMLTFLQAEDNNPAIQSLLTQLNRVIVHWNQVKI